MRKYNDLCEEQRVAVAQAVFTIESGGCLRIAGRAGTGKTTVARAVMDAVPGCIPVAFTGRAAGNLRRKCGAGHTVHSVIYDYDTSKERWNLRQHVDAEWFLLDEAQMISKQMWSDLSSFGLPILCLGDNWQLEPIGDDPQLMRNPDLELRQIHRSGSAVIDFAEELRQNTLPVNTVAAGLDGLVRVHRSPLYSPMLKPEFHLSRYQIICGYNRTRVAINRKIREITGLRRRIEVGDRMVCLRNTPLLANGDQFYIGCCGPDRNDVVDARIGMPDGSGQRVKLYLGFVGREKVSAEEMRQVVERHGRDTIICDYGCAVTCHKMIGCEVDHVIVVDEAFPRESAFRWRYTAASRAATRVDWYQSIEFNEGSMV